MTTFSLRRVALNVVLLLVGALAAWEGLRLVGATRWWAERQIVREVDLPAGRRLACSSWRGDDLWVVTRAAREGEVAGEVFEVARAGGWGITREVYRLSERPAAAVPDGGAGDEP